MRNTLLLCLLSVGISTHAQEKSSDRVRVDRPDGHAPISIMNDHTHQQGELMFSYRFGMMNSQGLIQDTKTYKDDDVFEDYGVSPQKMSMSMHMIGAMYGVTDHFTLMAMAHYGINTMKSKTSSDKTFSTQASGIGDVYLGGIYKLLDVERQSLSVYAGLNAPTGKTANYDKNAAGEKMKLPYGMNLGSGTWDVSFGATYKKQWDEFSLGLQPSIIFRNNKGSKGKKNDEGYRLGDVYAVDMWGSVIPDKWFSISLHAQTRFEDAIHGKDEKLMTAMSPLSNPANSGNTQINGGIGVNFYVPHGPLQDLRVSAEFLQNLYQSVHGIQLDHTNSFVVGLQYTLKLKR